MKASCSTALLTGAGAHDFASYTRLAAELGFHGINIDLGPHSIFSPDSFPFHTCGHYVRCAQELAVDIHCISGMHISDTTMEQQTLMLRKMICISHALACPLVALTLPGPPETDSRRDFRRLIELVRDAVEFAQDIDICLAIEPAAGSCIKSMEHAAEFVDEVDRLNIGIVYNPAYHDMSSEKAPTAAAEIYKSYMLMIRLEPDTATAITHGRYDELLKIFRTVEFTEYVCDCSPCPRDESENEIAGLILQNFEYLRSLNILD
jgi:sugar phosphate isomerase/epimerase